MDPEPVRPSTVEAAGRALGALPSEGPAVDLVALEPVPTPFTDPFRARHPDRYHPVPSESVRAAIDLAADLAADGRAVIVAGSSDVLVADGFAALRRKVAVPRRNVKVVTTDGGWHASNPAVLEDIALLQGLPGLSIVIPADARSAEESVIAITRMDGPAYLRLSPEPAPPLEGPAFALGRVRELHPGDDLAMVAIGPTVAIAVRAAEELGRVGVQARVLDCASLRPLDEKAILRAARDTGALLSLEEQQVMTGLGSLVAALTAENHPVFVRRVGTPDLVGPPGAPAPGREALGLTLASVLDEAWELLRQKGKVQ